VAESGLSFLVNFSDYLDTGLFLDHRLTRQRLREAAAGRRFLNLFCYTASATVYAAAGGARASLGVDLSANYLDWAGENFRVNGLARAEHELARADCREWLAEARAASWDLIFLDPPTSAGRLAGPIAGASQNPREHVAHPVDHVGVVVTTLSDQADVLGNGGMRGTCPLAIDDLVEIRRVGRFCWLQNTVSVFGSAQTAESLDGINTSRVASGLASRKMADMLTTEIRHPATRPRWRACPIPRFQC
jgi:hypothetical protein